MNCPHCGKELNLSGVDWNKRLKDGIGRRLEQYGHSTGMSPQKYQAYVAVRGVIKLYVEIGIGSKSLTPDQYSECLKVLDKILPLKEKEQ